MEIKLPKDKSGLRIKHLPVLYDERLSAAAPTMSLKIDVLHKFTGLPKPNLHLINGEDIAKMFTHLLTIIASMDKESQPPKEIVLDGQTFTLVDFEKVGAGWHADVESSEFDVDPVRLACICYIPNGTFYGEIDQHQNLKYPIADRWQLFYDHFPLETFLQLSAFFLRRFNQSMSEFIKRARKRIRKERRKAVMIGLWSSMCSLKKWAFRGTKSSK